MQRHILKRGEPGLTEKSEPISDVAEATDTVNDLWDTLRAVQPLYEFSRGSGLSAPQIGSLKRIAVVEYGDQSWTFINPEIADWSEERVTIREGCLSFFGYRGTTERYATVIVEAMDEHGNSFSVEAEGELSSLLQHEIDHLDGILFDERLAPGEELAKVEGMPEIP